MTRYELVKSAMEHKQADRVPSCIHLAGDGWEWPLYGLGRDGSLCK